MIFSLLSKEKKAMSRWVSVDPVPNLTDIKVDVPVLNLPDCRGWPEESFQTDGGWLKAQDWNPLFDELQK